MPQKLQNVFKPLNHVVIDNERQPFPLWDHHQDNNISKNNIHSMHLINIGRAPSFRIIFIWKYCSLCPFILHYIKIEE
jgi:hypothetical protein